MATKTSGALKASQSVFFEALRARSDVLVYDAALFGEARSTILDMSIMICLRMQMIWMIWKKRMTSEVAKDVAAKVSFVRVPTSTS